MNAESEQMLRNDGRSGSSTSYIHSNRFFQELAHRTFGTSRLREILSGISPGTRSRYLIARRHWVGFMHGQGESMDWAKYFQLGRWSKRFHALRGENVGGRCADHTRKYRSRFWRIISGYHDFPPVGGRFRHVLGSSKREHKVKRKHTVTFEILNWIRSEFWEAGVSPGAGMELRCAILMGCFYRTSHYRIGAFEMGKLQVRYRYRRRSGHYVRNRPWGNISVQRGRE